MEDVKRVVLWLALFCYLCGFSLAYPLCLNFEAPRPRSSPLKFCSAPEYSKNGCCDSIADSQLSSQFKSMNQSKSDCATVIQQILCARCDQFAAQLFGVELSSSRTVPYLCRSGTSSYCLDVWEACGNVSIPNSLFSPKLEQAPPGGVALSSSLLESESTVLSLLFPNVTEFCASFGPPSDADFCFSGKPYTPLSSENQVPSSSPPGSICLDKVETGAYLSLIPHPDGSNRAFLAEQSGRIWLASVPEQGAIGVNKTVPFLDLSDRVVNEGESGLLGLAFHPDFVVNGRFFVSYICDKQKWADCGGKCACYSDVGCDPLDLGSLAGPFPCRYSSVIAEYSANGSDDIPPSMVVQANLTEVQRIFTMGLPYPNHHGGQILFGPLDAYLYLMMGDGGNSGDPYNFAQNKKSLLGKILRFDIDNLPSEEDRLNLDLWGNYLPPESNPFFNDKNARSEIWALGLRNPWRCSFDSASPLYFYCGDVGQDSYEEVNLISKGGNYGWRVYEGDSLFNASWTPGGSTKPSSVQAIFPILVYSHTNLSAPGAASITGGYASRSTLDPCIYGRYLYADLYGTVWVATETPTGAGNYTTSAISYQCAASSPLPCDIVGPADSPSLQPIFSFGEDGRRNLYMLTNSGVYRVTNPGKCNMVCKESLPSSPAGPPAVPPAPVNQPSDASAAEVGKRLVTAALVAYLVFTIYGVV